MERSEEKVKNKGMGERNHNKINRNGEQEKKQGEFFCRPVAVNFSQLLLCISSFTLLTKLLIEKS